MGWEKELDAAGYLDQEIVRVISDNILEYGGVWLSKVTHPSCTPSPRWCDFKPDFALARNKKKTVKKIVQSEKKRKSPKPSVYETLGNSQVVKQAPCNWQLSPPLNSIDARFTISLFTSIFSVARNTRLCSLCKSWKEIFEDNGARRCAWVRNPIPPFRTSGLLVKSESRTDLKIPLISSQLVNKWSEMVSVNNDFI